MALVAKSRDNSISVLSVNGTDVKLTDPLRCPTASAYVVVPRGRQAGAGRAISGSQGVGTRHRRRTKVTYNRSICRPGQWPYNVVVTPNGKLALTSDNGGGRLVGRQRRHDKRDRSRSQSAAHIDRVVVGDGPEGLAMSPKAISRSPPSCAAPHEEGVLLSEERQPLGLEIDGQKVVKTQDIEVGGLPEAVMFTRTGNTFLAGNYITQDFSILKVNGTRGHGTEALQGAGASGFGGA